MLKTTIKVQENSAVIVLPFSELNELEMSVGDEIELLKNGDEEIIVRSVKKTNGHNEFCKKLRKLLTVESALLGLGKGHE